MKQIAKLAQLKDGSCAWYEKRKSWNHSYYSFDDANSWHRGITDAIAAARRSNSFVIQGADENAARGMRISYREGVRR